MRPCRTLSMKLALCLLSGWTLHRDIESAQAQQPQIELEVFSTSSFDAVGHQRWLRFLKGVEVADLRLRSGRLGDEPKIERRGSELAPRYHVVGMIVDNELVVPGAAFRYGEKALLEKWIAELREKGPEGMLTPTGAFGLTAEQLEKVHKSLAGALKFTTQGEPASQILPRITKGLAIEVEYSTEARLTLAKDDRVRDELRGLSSGTAMAAVLRPMGLILVPRSKQGQVELRVAGSTESKEFWPVGWPSKKSPGQTAPGLFKFLNAEIDDNPLDESISAVAGRADLPVLVDHNSLLRHRIDYSQNVSFPRTRTFYKKLLDSILYQAKLKVEVRVDDGERPFLWISTLAR